MLCRDYLILLLLAVVSANSIAADSISNKQQDNKASISIIIDDVGYRQREDMRAANLPGAISYAILPHAPYGPRMAKLLHSLDRDVIVHIPMEAERSNHLLGPGALTATMPTAEFRTSLHDSIASVPHAIAVSNHMGSLLTRDPEAMHQLMQLLQPLGLSYIDSKTSAQSVAAKAASDWGIPFLQRDVFLDHDRDPEAIRYQYTQLLAKARRDGSAIAIGHPYPETLAILAELLPGLAGENIRLVGIRSLLQQQKAVIAGGKRNRLHLSASGN
ncbi:MAG: divergent polysaccharide deacetylase family protein [Gammaproteobacteria bacterium]